jgi:pimeloyl-ACP methyl ester carboxylesterase
VILFVLLLAAMFAAALAYEGLGEHLDDRRLPPPGRLIDIGKCRLHVHSEGTGTPAVILESGIAASSLSWALVQPKIARFARVLSYDRAGLGWSSACKTPRTVEAMLSELATVLEKADCRGPFILVGHSFGGLLVRAFAHFRPGDVAGLILVDPVSLSGWADCEPNQLRRLGAGVKLSRRGATLARFGVVRAILAILAAGGRWLPKAVAHASAGRGSSVIERLIGEVRRLPAELHPMVRAHWSRAKSFQAMAGYLDCLPESARIAQQMPIPAEIPLIVLSASTATDAELEERESWVAMSESGRHVRVKDTGHWIQLEQPDAVVAAVRELLQ